MSRTSREHQAAIQRRLRLLTAEFDAIRAAQGRAREGPDALSESADLAHRPQLSTSGQDLSEPDPSEGDRPEWDRPEWDRPEQAVADAGLMIAPGRHSASRSADRLVGRWLPEVFRGRVALGGPHMVVVLVAAIAGVVVVTWWLLRGSQADLVAVTPAEPLVSLSTGSPPTESITTAAHGGSADGSTASQPAAAEAAPSVVVDVAGKVRRPGLAVLPVGSRVADALSAAGGVKAGVDLTSLNLARRLVDGEQILVGLPPDPGAAAAAVDGVGAAPGTTPALVDLNAASPAQLEELPQVGPVTAAAIVAWRDQHGGFTAVEELLEVDGIGEATLAQLAPFVTV